jgi:putative ABC transport system permease protein
MRRLQFLLAIRQLQRAKGFTALNILGLTLGLATFLLIVLFVRDELSYDRWNVKADRICRINTDLRAGGKLTHFADAAPPVAPTLVHKFPEVEKVARLLPVQGGLRFAKGNTEVQETRVVMCDPEILSIFTLSFVDGNPATALQRPNSIVITETTAKKYFGTIRAAGRTLRDIDDTVSVTIDGVIRDLPAQSSFHYDVFFSMRGNGMEKDPGFYSIFPMSTFVLLKPGADRALFDKKLGDLMRDYVPEYAAIEKDNAGEYYLTLGETPLTDIHLRSDRTDELSPNGNIQYVYIFSAIAVFVLLLAAINFMNLSTARSANRAREVGVRKVLGSQRGALVAQFLTESLIVTLIATLLAFGLAIAVLPWFNQLADKHLAFDAHTLGWMLPFTAPVILVVGLLAGLYPAFFLSAFRPVEVLKGRLASGFRGAAMRSLLVIFQFTVSLFLIIGTLTIYRQLHYIQSKDLGFDRDRVLIIKGMNSLTNPAVLEKEVLQLPGIADATLTGFLPTNDKRWHNSGSAAGTGDGGWCQLWKGDIGYVPTLGLDIVAGRNFSPAFGTDSSGIIINEAAEKLFGIGGDALNKNISFAWYGRQRTFHCIGVVKDFHFSSLRENIEPLALIMDVDEDANLLAVRAKTDDLPSLLARLKDRWTALMPNRAFEYSFMDADFNALYRTEQRMGRISILFSALAIAIACLGLFALAAYAAERRVKEISIRKVLGASIPNILTLLSANFLKLILISMLIAAPLAWIALRAWLDNFAYRTTISPWLFVLGGVIVILIALCTTLYQSLRAAISNPVDSLRNE